MQSIGTKTVNGVDLEIRASSDGMFRLGTVVGGDWEEYGYGETLDAAIAKARQYINKQKVKVAVPFITLQGKRGHAVGLHAKTRKVLTEVGDLKPQIDNYAMVFKADTPQAIITEFLANQRERERLQRRNRDIERDYHMKLGPAVEHAIQAAQAETPKPLAAGRTKRRR